MIPEELDFTIIYAARYRGMNKSETHRHMLFQLYILCSDRLELFDGKEIINCDPGREILLVKPELPHVLSMKSSAEDSDWLAPGINCALDCKFAVNSDTLRKKLLSLPTKITVSDTSVFLTLASLVLDSLAMPDNSGLSAAYSAFATLLNLMISGGNVSDPVKSQPYFFSSNHKHTADTEGINAVKRYIDLNYRSAIRLDELVQMSCVNRSSLCRIFREFYGTSPIDYVLKKRVDESRLLLAETSLEINELAERVGFSSSSYFSRIFRKQTGMSPAEYRDAAKKQYDLK